MNHQDASDLLDRTSVIPVPPVHAERWRNVRFDKAGNSYRGIKIFPSEIDAKRSSEKNDREMAAGLAMGVRTLDGILLSEDCAYTLQMPVGE